MSFSKSLTILQIASFLFFLGCSREEKSKSAVKSTVSTFNNLNSLPDIPGAVQVAAEVSESGYSQSSISLDVLPVGSGLSPKLALAYSSAMGSSDIAGYGWGLTGISSIARCPAHLKFEGAHRPIKMDDNDSICLDGKKLLLIEGRNLTEGAQYRAYLDNFSRIEFSGGFFQLITRSGEKWTFGETTGSREFGSGTAILTWYLNRIEDRSGNTIEFSYNPHGNRIYLDKVVYGGNRVFQKPHYRSIQFQYTDSGRIQRRYVAGRGFDSGLFLKQIDVASSAVQWSYHLSYKNIENFAYPILDSVRQCFKNAACFPATKFRYQGGQTPEIKEFESMILKEFSTTVAGKWATGNAGRAFQDINGDGFIDFIAIRKSEIAYSLGSRNGMQEQMTFPLPETENWNPSYDMFSLNDMNQDGYPDIVVFLSKATMSGVYVSHWNGAGYKGFEKISDSFGKDWTVRSDFRYIADANNDGLPDIMGIRADGVYLALNQDGRFVGGDRPVLEAMGFNHRWSRVEHPRFFVDVNADGLIDILGLWSTDVQVALGNGKGFDQPTQWMNGFGYDRFYSNSTAFRRIADMNGDGLIDLVGYARDGIYVALNTGNGFAQDEKWLSDQVASKRWDSSFDRRFLFDANRDGLTDFIGFKKDGVQIVYGEGRPIDGKLPVISPRLVKLNDWSSSAGEIEVEDLNGDGSLEFLFSSKSGYWGAAIRSAPLQLVGIEDGLGNLTSFVYAEISDTAVYSKTSQPKYPKISVAGHFPVVKEISRAGSNGVDFKVSYRYEDGAFDVQGFGFLGFAKRIVLDHKSGTETHEFYSQDTSRLIHGSLEKVETYTLNGGRKIVSSTSSNFESRVLADHQLHRFAYEKSSMSRFYNEAGAEIYTIKIQNEYDEFRNAKYVETEVQDKSGIYKTIVETVFENDEVNWQIGRVKRIKTTKSDSLNAKKIVNISEFGYDNEGRMSFELQEPDSPLWIKKEFQRSLNPYGLVNDVVTSWGPEHGKGLGFVQVTSSTKYDSQGFVQDEVNALDHVARYPLT